MSMPIFNDKSELASYFKFIVGSKADENALDIAWGYYVNHTYGYGCYGAIAETLTRTTHSHKTGMSKQGKVDCYVKALNDNGTIVNYPTESKTNSGRLTFNGRYVVYTYDYCNSNTGYKRRFVAQKVFRKEYFAAKAIELGAVKVCRRDGKFDGYGLQASLIAWYDFLLKYGLEFDRNRVYTEEDFINAEF